MKKTKIIVTIGPSSKDEEVLKKLMISGMDVARINLTHANASFCTDIVRKINDLNKKLNKNVSIMFDLKGPDITVSKFVGGSTYLNTGDKIRIYMDEILGDSTKFSTSYNKLIDVVKTNTIIKISDGLIELKVLEKGMNYILCEVVHGGFVEDNKGINIIGVDLKIPFLSEKDKQDIILAHKLNVDYIALSLVKSSEDVLQVNDLLISLEDDHIGIVSKIENEKAVEDIDEIIKNSEAVMIARGDLGVELPLERIPRIQKMIINKCHLYGKVSVVATEMMSSMETAIRPTRAEVSDVSNAVLEGVDAVMLSGETTIGKYPIETLETMSKIVETAEQDQDYLTFLDTSMRTEKQDITGSVALSSVENVIRLKCKAIVVPTISGYTARKISRFRPNCPIIALTSNKETYKSLNIYYGIYTILIDDIKSFDKIMELSKKYAKDILDLNEKDKIVITGGYPFKEVKHTNFMKIEEI